MHSMMRHITVVSRRLIGHENETAFLSWTSRDILSWSHRDTVHITKGHLLSYPLHRCGEEHLCPSKGQWDTLSALLERQAWCLVSARIAFAATVCTGGFERCHLQHCIA